MPKRDDINKVLIIGSGPIIIGQACEFDYSGTQACKALRQLGYEVVLVNSNPATIMTDPDTADAVYIEPLNTARLEQIIAKERPDALLPNLGGQSGLNLAADLAKQGILEKYDVQVIGVQIDAIERGEDREAFKELMESLDIEMARSKVAYSVEDAVAIADELGYPCVLRPAYTMGGTGGGLVYNIDELRTVVARGLAASPVHEVLVEESVLGWEELELEVVRDANGKMITVCFIENIDPMGVHTGDSFCAAPMLTISEDVQKRLQEKSYKIVEAVQVIGGTNVQWAHDPVTDRDIIIEINPRTSRSSALASKATGFPIALVSAMLASGLTLDEIPCGKHGTLANYVPGGDYVVIKFARWAFEKFKGVEDKLGTQMRAVGEVMSIGKTYKEAFQKAIRSLETGRYGLGFAKDFHGKSKDELLGMLVTPTSERQFIMYEALRAGATVDELHELTRIKRWFIEQMAELVAEEEALIAYSKDHPASLPPDDMLTAAKKDGFSDRYLAQITGTTEKRIRAHRAEIGLNQGWEGVHVSSTQDSAYYYSTYNAADASPTTGDNTIMILGGGPNRIGQGIEFDYCCVHAAKSLKKLGFKTIIVNCNPETVSTDYDTSDKLYFEPLTYEDVMDIVDAERPDGVIVTLGGQTPLKLAKPLLEAGVPIMGTQPEAIDLAEDRERFAAILDELAITYPAAGEATTFEEACRVADRIGFPLLVRPSYVLGGRGMAIVYDGAQLEKYMGEAAKISLDHPVYLDRFLEGAVEVDLDALCDGERVYVGGVLEHIEEAGIHSGDSACCTPPFALSEALVSQLRSIARRLALRLGVVGLINIQFAIKDTVIYVIEANPRASRTVPFVSKATGVPLAKLAARVMAGEKLADLNLPDDERRLEHFSVKEAVMPFGRFPGADVVLGPEMKSTGEVMGIARNFPAAYAKTQLAISYELPQEGTVFISVCDRDKRSIIPIARDIARLGFKIVATSGTERALSAAGIDCELVKKVREGSPNVIDRIASGEVTLMINTPFGHETRSDGYELRAAAVRHGLTYVTTLSAAQAFVAGMEVSREAGFDVVALQDLPQWERPAAAAR